MAELPQLRQQRDLGAVIGDAFTILSSDLSSLAKTVAPAVLVSVAVSLVLYGLRNDQTLTTIAVYVALPFLLIAFQLVSAAVIARLNARDQGRELESGDALDVAQDRFGDVISASVKATGIVFLLSLTVVGIPWAVKRLVKWAFIIQSIIVDGQTGETALAYSESLVLGRWWVTFGRLLGTWLVLVIPTVILNQVVLAAVPGVAGIIASHATDFVTLPFGMITTTLIFFDLKLRSNASA